MDYNRPYTRIQLITLVGLRFIIGWHILYEGISKLLSPNWTSAGFLRESQWIMSGLSRWILSNDGVLNVVDILNTWGLIAIGVGLIVGFCTRTAAISGALLLFMYYLNNAPIIGIEYSIPSEGNNLIVNKTLIEVVALFILVVFPTGSIIGFDSLIAQFKSRKNKKGGIHHDNR